MEPPCARPLDPVAALPCFLAARGLWGARMTQQFPRKDADGRVVRLPELSAAAAFGTLVGFVGVLLVDGVFALIGLGRFGQLSGWLAAILPVLLFADEVRAWRGVPGRAGAAGLAAVLALVVGFGASALAAGWLPPVGSGAIGALVGVEIYAALWYVGIRWLAHRGVRQ